MSKYTERARQRQEQDKNAARELSRREREKEAQRARRLRIADALEHEFHFAREESREHTWKGASMYFELKGPIALHTEYLPPETPDDDDCIGITIGELVLAVPIFEAEAVAFGILKSLYTDDWARLIMALCRRYPLDGSEPEVATQAAQALWKAAYSYKAHWPELTKGFDDAIWGVAPPKGVKAQYPEGSKPLETGEAL